MRELLAHGADAGAINNNGAAPLWVACANANQDADYVDVATLLLDTGADVNRTDNNQATPIRAAGSRGNVALVELLIARGADVNRATSSGLTALGSALSNVHILSRLVAAGANIDSIDFEGDVPIGDAATAGYNDAIELLLSLGARVDMYNLWGNAPVHLAARGDNLGALQAFLNHDPDLGYLKTKHGRGVLHVAVAHKSTGVAQFLLEKGLADANEPCARSISLPLPDTVKCTHVNKVVQIDGLKVVGKTQKSFNSTNLTAQFPTKSGLSYFEVELVAKPEGKSIAVGIGMPDSLHGNKDIGLAAGTFGYYSNTGLTFFGGSLSSRQAFGPKFGERDTIGLLWNRTYRTVSYTKNGEFLGIAFRDVPEDDMAAAVRISQGCTVVFNFGLQVCYPRPSIATPLRM